MKYEQNIPFYIIKFKDYPWKIYESDHYVFHVEADSLAEKEIGEIKVKQEAIYKKVTETLKLQEPEQKIQYYFYSSQDKKAELMGDSWYGQSIYNEFEQTRNTQQRNKACLNFATFPLFWQTKNSPRAGGNNQRYCQGL